MDLASENNVARPSVSQRIVAQCQQQVTGLFEAYSAIFFVNKPWVGALFLAATLMHLNVGLCGLVAALVARGFSPLLHFSHQQSALYTYNSLLVGLSLGAVYQLSFPLLILVTVGAALAVFMTVALSDFLWRLDHLSPLSLPFVLVAFICAFAGQSFSNLDLFLLPYLPDELVHIPFISPFLKALGSALFSPLPLAGGLIFCGLVLSSRYLALLALCGFMVGQGSLTYLFVLQDAELNAWVGFNFIFTAMAIGGYFTQPAWQSFLLAMLGALIAAIITAATQNMLLMFGLPVMAIPFLASTFVLLVALRKRVSLKPPVLLLEHPNLPERSMELARLASSRGLSRESTALQAPFFGSWQVYQGFNGKHTHQAPWQYALDFYQQRNAKSYLSQGKELSDYYCFGLPICAPASGKVVQVVTHLPDNVPGEVDTVNNWGNYLLILLDNGCYLLLAHLKQHSILAVIGEYVVAGQVLAHCGNSGRSPQPHLHMHLQASMVLGAPTLPFHLSAVLLKSAKQDKFQLFCRPKEQDHIMRPSPDASLRKGLHLPVGRQLSYRYQLADRIPRMARLSVVLSLTGQFSLRCETKALNEPKQNPCLKHLRPQAHQQRCSEVSFIESENLLSFFDRSGDQEPFLDYWLLSLGLTPFAKGDYQWSDRASAALFHHRWQQRWLFHCLHPLGSGLKSLYQGHLKEEHRVQQGLHQFQWLAIKNEAITKRLSPRLQRLVSCLSFTRELKTQALLSELGCYFFSASKQGKTCIRAELLEIGMLADSGIPSWQAGIAVESDCQNKSSNIIKEEAK